MIIPLLAFGLAGVSFWLLRDPGPVVDQNAAASQAEMQKMLEPGKPQLETEPEVQPDDIPVAFTPVPPPMIRCSTNELMAILPLWMQQEADVDAYADERIVAGAQVTRVRGRYAWSNGSQMEVEISDLGTAPSDLLLRSLGYNTSLTNHVNESGFQLHIDDVNAPSNFEYDYGTGEGSLQMLVADRFLVEVQLELLLEESFEAVIEHQVPLAVLEKIAAEQK